MDITKAQKQAIMHQNGPMMVLAGPGSGKTLVITKRTQALIEEHGVNPKDILVITFTKAAAEEMKERFLNMMEAKQTAVNFGTFHAVFFTILKYAYNYNASNIIREEERNRLFKEIVKKLSIEIEDEKEFITSISSEISLVKSERMDLKHYYSMNCSEDAFQTIYKEYDNYLRRKNLIDFDDMLLLCYELLVKRPDILIFWQQKFQYILIDEFQDINQVQYDIIRLLAKPQNNLFIVGDDDQSIYRFRGAKPEIILNFRNDYKDCKQVLLDCNFRSTANIVEGALQVVRNNQNRFEKSIRAVHPVGEPIHVETFKTLIDENTALINEIIQLKKSGIPFQKMAVLFRTNTGPRALIDKFMEYNIPFRMKDMIPNIFDHWITKNIVAYMRLAKGETDRTLYLEVINRPKRYMSRECFTEQNVTLDEIRAFYQDKSWVIERVDKLQYDLMMLKKMDPFAAINYIRKGIGYDEYLAEYAQFRRIKVEELYDTLDELQESAKGYQTFADWFTHMVEYKEELKQQMESRKNKNVDSVSLSTMHSSKGLEYEVVFIIDANEGITPHRKAILDEDLEEERRMFYVAMTRAKRRLYIYSVKERYNKDLTRSRFVGELIFNKDILEKGTLVEHKSYGKGKIVSIEDGKVSIYFDRLHKQRVLDLEFCIQNELLTVRAQQ